MKRKRTELRVFLDEGVPASVARAFQEAGHTAILHHEALAKGEPDEVVCQAALLNEAILIAQDKDMKQLVKRYGQDPDGSRFGNLSIILICCNEVLASKRVAFAMSLIEHEWKHCCAKNARVLWIEVHPHYVKTWR